MNTLSPKDLATYRMAVGKAVQEGEDPKAAAEQNLKFFARTRTGGLNGEERGVLLREVKELLEAPVTRRSEAADKVVLEASAQLKKSPVELLKRLGARLRDARREAEVTTTAPTEVVRKEDSVLRAECREATLKLIRAMRPEFGADVGRVLDALGRDASPDIYAYIMQGWVKEIEFGLQRENLSKSEIEALREAATAFSRIGSDATTPGGGMFVYSYSFGITASVPKLLQSLMRPAGILEGAGDASTPEQKYGAIIDTLRAGMRPEFGADLDRLVARLGGEEPGYLAGSLVKILNELLLSGLLSKQMENLSQAERSLIDRSVKALYDVQRETGIGEVYPFQSIHLGHELTESFPSLNQPQGVFPKADLEAEQRAFSAIIERMRQELGPGVEPLLDLVSKDSVAFQAYALSEAALRLASENGSSRALVEIYNDLRELVRRTATQQDRSSMYSGLLSRGADFQRAISQLQ